MKEFPSIYFRIFRIQEVVLMVGFFLVGSFFSISAISFLSIQKLFVYSIAVFLFITGIYMFNAFSGYSSDVTNERLSFFYRKKPKEFLGFFSVFSVLSLWIFYVIDPILMRFAVIVLLLWVLYSLPKVGLKAFPVTGTVVHFISQVIHFQMGYVLFRPVDVTALFISIYFALLFSGGHFHHESIDYDADKRHGIQTSAVCFGDHMARNISFCIFCLSIIYWALLYYIKILTFWEFLPFGIAFFAHGVSFVIYARKTQYSQYIKIHYRALYRVYYLTAGLVLSVIKIVNFY